MRNYKWNNFRKHTDLFLGHEMSCQRTKQKSYVTFIFTFFSEETQILMLYMIGQPKGSGELLTKLHRPTSQVGQSTLLDKNLIFFIFLILSLRQSPI